MGHSDVIVEGSVSAWASVFNVGNCAIGAGVLSFPYAFRCAGLLGGILLCFLIAAAEGFTLRILMRQSQKHRCSSYQDLVLKGVGPRSAEAMAWIILAYLFGSCVAYLIIVGDTFGPLIREYVIEPLDLPPGLGDRRTMISFSAVTVILPLSLQRTMGALAGVSTLAVTAMLSTTFVIVYQAFHQFANGDINFAGWLPEHVNLFIFDADTFLGVPIMVFAYHCHVQAVPIFQELTDNPTLSLFAKPRVPGSPRVGIDSTNGGVEAGGAAAHTGNSIVAKRRLLGMYDVLTAAYAECTIMYVTVGIFGYLLFPETATANILNNFSRTDLLFQATRFFVGWAVLFHYPINQHVARTAIHDLLCKHTRMRQCAVIPYSRLAGMTILFFVLSVSLACIISDLGIVFQIIGGVAGSLLIFVLPGSLLIFDKPAAEIPSERSSNESAENDQMRLLPTAPVGESMIEDRNSSALWQNSKQMGYLLVSTGVTVIVISLYTTMLAVTHTPTARPGREWSATE